MTIKRWESQWDFKKWCFRALRKAVAFWAQFLLSSLKLDLLYNVLRGKEFISEPKIHRFITRNPLCFGFTSFCLQMFCPLNMNFKLRLHTTTWPPKNCVLYPFFFFQWRLILTSTYARLLALYSLRVCYIPFYDTVSISFPSFLLPGQKFEDMSHSICYCPFLEQSILLCSKCDAFLPC